MQKKRVGVVADDITGANDIGVMLAGNGYLSGIFSLQGMPSPKDAAGLDAVIINTDSRLDDGRTAALKTEEACRFLQSLPCDVYYSKTCSVFRGNIGAQFDAMRRCLNAGCSMVVLGFPRNGRTTVHGIHYVNGVRLQDTMFRNDPIHPMLESDLKAILSGQSTGRAAVFDCGCLDLPEAEARTELDRLKACNEYIIFDVRHQQDLKTVARLIADEKSLCGSSAICEELPKVWAGGQPPTDGVQSLVHRVFDPCGTFVISGSLTKPAGEQVDHLLKAGVSAAELNTLELFDEKARGQHIARLADELCPILKGGSPALLYTPREEDRVLITKETGRAHGLDDVRVGRLISQTLADIASLVSKRTNLKKVVAAGGETSAAVAGGLGIHKMIILNEIEAGVPAMYGYTEEGTEMLLVFKSGSFGSPAFLAKSIASLNRLQEGSLPA